ncbi:hypothetical protein Golomagni_02707 [Golovinomyces magnicellulatus]|nr:hypothetical protein Golomagni_02707 [Golovinomyces magnicellulatus]
MVSQTSSYALMNSNDTSVNNQMEDKDRESMQSDYRPLGLRIRPNPINIHQYNLHNTENSGSIFRSRPIFGALLFENSSSDARDLCANERTFLSYLRLSVSMAILSMALVISFSFEAPRFHVKPRLSQSLGLTFWGMSVICLGLGLGTYLKAVTKLSQSAVIVQSGWKTKFVSRLISAVLLQLGRSAAKKC